MNSLCKARHPTLGRLVMIDATRCLPIQKRGRRFTATLAVGAAVFPLPTWPNHHPALSPGSLAIAWTYTLLNSASSLVHFGGYTGVKIVR